ncbi:MAG: MFS transporter [Enterococcus sp.]
MKQTKQIHLVWAVLATGLMSFSGVLIETAMNVTFPTLIEQFHLTTAQVQWVTTIYLLMISIIVPLSTYLNRNFQLRSLFIFSNILFLTGILLDFLSPSFSILLFGRVLQGIATGIALPLMFHIILSYAPLNRRGAMMGLGTLTTAIAPAIGPTYGGILTDHLSWNHIFLFLIPVLLLSLCLGIWAIPAFPVKKSGKIDLLGLVSLTIFFSSSLIFLSNLGQPSSWIALLLAISSVYYFYIHSKKSAYPLIQLAILKNKTFRLFLFSFLVYQFLLLGVSFVLPNFIQLVQGNSPFVAGVAMLPGAAIGALLSPYSGRLLDTYGPKKPILIGLTFATTGWLILTISLQGTLLWPLIACHIFYMIGIGLSYSNMMTTGMNALTADEQADGNALFNTLQQFSGAIATSLVATVIGLVQMMDRFSYTEATTLGSQLALGILLVLVALSFFFCVRYFSKEKRK